MTATLPMFAKDVHTVSEPLNPPEVALDWLHAKDIENAAKPAEKIRKVAGLALKTLIGDGGLVTVNKGGFRTYALNVTPNKGRVSADKVLAQLVAKHPELASEVETLSEESRNPFEVITLKPNKS